MKNNIFPSRFPEHSAFKERVMVIALNAVFGSCEKLNIGNQWLAIFVGLNFDKNHVFLPLKSF